MTMYNIKTHALESAEELLRLLFRAVHGGEGLAPDLLEELHRPTSNHM